MAVFGLRVDNSVAFFMGRNGFPVWTVWYLNAFVYLGGRCTGCRSRRAVMGWNGWKDTVFDRSLWGEKINGPIVPAGFPGAALQKQRRPIRARRTHSWKKLYEASVFMLTTRI